MRASSDNLLVPRSFQFQANGKRRMTNEEIPSNDISIGLNIYSIEPSSTAIATREDNVEDVNDDDISMEMNKQVLQKELSPPNVKLNYN